MDTSRRGAEQTCKSLQCPTALKLGRRMVSLEAYDEAVEGVLALDTQVFNVRVNVPLPRKAISLTKLSSSIGAGCLVCESTFGSLSAGHVALVEVARSARAAELLDVLKDWLEVEGLVWAFDTFGGRAAHGRSNAGCQGFCALAPQ